LIKNNFDAKEQTQYKNQIYFNILQIINQIMKELVEVKEEREEYMILRKITKNEVELKNKSYKIYNSSVYKAILKVFYEEEIQEIWYKKVKEKTADGVKRIIENIKEYDPESYKLREKDVMLLKKKTLEKEERKMQFGKNTFTLIDLGGSINERK
jgi:hypothetical protein